MATQPHRKLLSALALIGALLLFALLLAACYPAQPLPPLLVTMVPHPQRTLEPAMIWEAVTPEPPARRGQSRAILAGQTAYPMAVMRDASTQATAMPPLRPTEDPLYVTGARYPLAWNCNSNYLDDMWPTAGTGNIVWTPFDDCFTTAAAYTVTLANGTVISQPVSLDIPSQFLVGDNGAGTVGDPFLAPRVSAWMSATTTFTVNGRYYDAIKYNASFLGYIEDFVAAAGARYDGNPQLAVVRAYVGVDGEDAPTKAVSPDDSNDVLVAHEAAVVSCATYKAFVQGVAEALWTAFPNHEVLVMSAAVPCAGSTSESFRSDLYETWATASPQKRIGGSLNSLIGDRFTADAGPVGSWWQPWMQLSTFRTLNSADYGFPTYAEFGDSATGSSVTASGDVWRYLYWNLLTGAGTGADWVSYNYTFAPYMTAEHWSIVDYWLAVDTRAAIAFRDKEYAEWGWGEGYSGYQGDFTKGLVLLTPTAYPPVCVSALATAGAQRYTDAGAMATPPAPCNGGVLPTPKATFQATPLPDPTSDFNMFQRIRNWQARSIAASSTLMLKLASTYPSCGLTKNLTVELVYLDIGTADVTVQLNGGSSHVFARGNTGLWQRETWAASSIVLTNSLTVAGLTGFASIAPSTSLLYVSEFHFDETSTSETVTPTATPTATPTGNTPTSTRTSTPPISTTPTATPTSTSSLTPTVTQTSTVTQTPTITRTPTNTATITQTPTPTASRTPTSTPTSAPTSTPTVTQTPTVTTTPSPTGPAGWTPTVTRTSTATATSTPTSTATVTLTPLPTATGNTNTPTSTSTSVSSSTPTKTLTPTSTVTRTSTPTSTNTSTSTPTATPTNTPLPSSTPAFFWDNMEGTPPGKWVYDQNYPTVTPTYWPTIVVNSTQFVDGSQSYQVSGVNCVGIGCTAQGGLHYALPVTSTVGFFGTRLHVFNWNSWAGQGGFTAARGKGTRNGVLLDFWRLRLNKDNDGFVRFAVDTTAYSSCTPSCSITLTTVSLNTWYTATVGWQIGTTSIFTLTWDNTVGVITGTAASGTLSAISAVDIGVYADYIYGTKPQAAFDAAFLVTGYSNTTPTPVPTPTSTNTPTPTMTPTSSLTPTTAPTATRTPFGYLYTATPAATAGLGETTLGGCWIPDPYVGCANPPIPAVTGLNGGYNYAAIGVIWPAVEYATEFCTTGANADWYLRAWANGWSSGTTGSNTCYAAGIIEGIDLDCQPKYYGNPALDGGMTGVVPPLDNLNTIWGTTTINYAGPIAPGVYSLRIWGGVNACWGTNPAACLTELQAYWGVSCPGIIITVTPVPALSPTPSQTPTSTATGRPTRTPFPYATETVTVTPTATACIGGNCPTPTRFVPTLATPTPFAPTPASTITTAPTATPVPTRTRFTG